MNKTRKSSYYIAFITLIIIDAGISGSLLNQYRWADILHDFCLVSSIFCAILCILSKRLSTRYTIILVLVMVVGIICYRISGNTDFFYTLMTIMLAEKTNMQTVLRHILRLKVVLLLIVVMSSIVGFTEIGSIATSSAEKGALLGFSHANGLGGSVGVIILLYLAVNRNKLNYRRLFIVLIAALATFYISRARIALFLILLTVIGIKIFNSKRKRKEKFLKYSKWAFIVILALNAAMIYLRYYHIVENITSRIDFLFNGRMLLSAMNLKYYPITLFGQSVDISRIASENDYYALDNGYIYILIHYGIVGLCIFCFFFQKSLITCRSNKDVVLTIIAIVFMIWSMYEGMMVFANTNFVLLFAYIDFDKQFLGVQEKGRNRLHKENDIVDASACG